MSKSILDMLSNRQTRFAIPPKMPKLGMVGLEESAPPSMTRFIELPADRIQKEVRRVSETDAVVIHLELGLNDEPSAFCDVVIDDAVMGALDQQSLNNYVRYLYTDAMVELMMTVARRVPKTEHKKQRTETQALDVACKGLMRVLSAGDKYTMRHTAHDTISAVRAILEGTES